MKIDSFNSNDQFKYSRGFITQELFIVQSVCLGVYSPIKARNFKIRLISKKTLKRFQLENMQQHTLKFHCVPNGKWPQWTLCESKSLILRIQDKSLSISLLIDKTSVDSNKPSKAFWLSMSELYVYNPRHADEPWHWAKQNIYCFYVVLENRGKYGKTNTT